MLDVCSPPNQLSPSASSYVPQEDNLGAALAGSSLLPVARFASGRLAGRQRAG
jgi:hypothetical protein